jgi:hypothetical protein
MSKLAKILPIPVRRPEPIDERPQPHGARRAARARWLLVALIAAGVALFTWGAVMSARQDRASIRRLALEERRGLYLRTLQEIATICREPAAADPGPVRDHCIAQARFLIELPDCEELCRRSAELILPHAHR